MDWEAVVLDERVEEREDVDFAVAMMDGAPRERREVLFVQQSVPSQQYVPSPQ